MPIDHTGTEPGLQSKEDEIPKINLRCKSFPQCDSVLAIEVKIPGMHPSTRLYRCVKCQRTWGVPVGGAFSP
jgi:DNA-directed RNA polymerase subunit M/transcription elongation factor TFIIS